jgi:hypothetical protein
MMEIQISMPGAHWSPGLQLVREGDPGGGTAGGGKRKTAKKAAKKPTKKKK